MICGQEFAGLMDSYLDIGTPGHPRAIRHHPKMLISGSYTVMSPVTLPLRRIRDANPLFMRYQTDLIHNSSPSIFNS